MRQTSTGSTRGVTGKQKVTKKSPVKPDNHTQTRLYSLQIELDNLFKPPRGSLKTFNSLAPVFNRALRKKTAHFTSKFTIKTLRSCLQSAEFAKTAFPAIPQKAWVGVIDLMVKEAEKQKMDTFLLRTWRANR